jgi:hypothetical protein
MSLSAPPDVPVADHVSHYISEDKPLSTRRQTAVYVAVAPPDMAGVHLSAQLAGPQESYVKSMPQLPFLSLAETMWSDCA